LMTSLHALVDGSSLGSRSGAGGATGMVTLT
jgi:hypothetical protein